MAEHQAVSNFREYLRINTAHPDPDYAGAVLFLRTQASEMGMAWDVVESAPGKPVVVMTWPGTEPSLPSLLLNSHIDVVPACPEHWNYPPFEAAKKDDGNIYARGAQDMKSVGIQYLEAIRRLKKEGKRFPRTIHVSFVPDEEKGGADGMGAYVKTSHFQKLNLGFALDEGLANPTDAFTVFYGERAVLMVKVTCLGYAGHGSRFVQNAAAEKLRKVINSFLDYRDIQERKLRDDPDLRLGDVTTLNMTIVQGGETTNVVPAKFSAVFDIRVTPTQSLAELEAMVADWCAEAGPGVKYEVLARTGTQTLTSTSPDNHWWRAFMRCMDALGCRIEEEIFSASTDSRFFRELGYPALGFSPMNNTPILLHDHNEFLNEEIYLRGIDIYSHLISQLASIPPSATSD